MQLVMKQGVYGLLLSAARIHWVDDPESLRAFVGMYNRQHGYSVQHPDEGVLVSGLSFDQAHTVANALSDASGMPYGVVHPVQLNCEIDLPVKTTIPPKDCAPVGKAFEAVIDQSLMTPISEQARQAFDAYVAALSRPIPEPHATHQIFFGPGIGQHWKDVILDGDMFVACSDGKTSWRVDGFKPEHVVKVPSRRISPTISERVMSLVENNPLNVDELGDIIYHCLTRDGIKQLRKKLKKFLS